jgi:hypothetical protein
MRKNNLKPNGTSGVRFSTFIGSTSGNKFYKMQKYATTLNVS